MQPVVPVALALGLIAATAAAQPAPIPLHDGQQVTLVGRLSMDPAGRLQFVTVKTAVAYVPVFHGESGGKDTRGDVLHAIGLAGYDDYGLLYAHRGQQVTVSGRLAIDDVSPYFWHGTSLKADSIRLPSGEDLRRSREPAHQPIAADTGTYQAAVMLPADPATPWKYRMNGQEVRRGRFLSCASNGGGDVINCFCADGFHAEAVEGTRHGKPNKGDRVLDGMAQVAAGDGVTPSALQIAVTCSR